MQADLLQTMKLIYHNRYISIDGPLKIFENLFSWVAGQLLSGRLLGPGAFSLFGFRALATTAVEQNEAPVHPEADVPAAYAKEASQGRSVPGGGEDPLTRPAQAIASRAWRGVLVVKTGVAGKLNHAEFSPLDEDFELAIDGGHPEVFSPRLSECADIGGT